MHQKRCEDIPAHFISKNSSRFQLRKNGVGSKLKWLSKYAADTQNQRQLNSLAQIGGKEQKKGMVGKQKERVSLSNKENIKICTQGDEQTDGANLETSLTNVFLSKIYRNSKAREGRQPRYSLTEETDKIKNQSLLLDRIYNRKMFVSFEADQRNFLGERGSNLEIKHWFVKAKECGKLAPSPWAITNSRSCDFTDQN